MVRCLSCLFVACIFGSAAMSGSPEGLLEGHMKIVSSSPVLPADETRARVTEQTSADYSAYPLIVLSREERREVTRVTADKNGNYRVALPPGDYILDVQDRVKKRLRVLTQAFTVVPNATVRVDLTVMTGFANE